MKWYYDNAGEAEGPHDDAAMSAFVTTGVITAKTLVWHRDLEAWQEAGDLISAWMRPVVTAPQNSKVKARETKAVSIVSTVAKLKTATGPLAAPAPAPALSAPAAASAIPPLTLPPQSPAKSLPAAAAAGAGAAGKTAGPPSGPHRIPVPKAPISQPKQDDGGLFGRLFGRGKKDKGGK